MVGDVLKSTYSFMRPPIQSDAPSDLAMCVRRLRGNSALKGRDTVTGCVRACQIHFRPQLEMAPQPRRP
eukprot:1756413-Pyramimonas_sp.AAC.1